MSWKCAPAAYDPRVHMPPPKLDFTRTGLTAGGYRGWMTFSALRPGGPGTVDSEGGTYVVLRVTGDPPVFLHISPAGHFKGVDPTVSPGQMLANWVNGPVSCTSARPTTLTCACGAWPRSALASASPTGAAGCSGSWRTRPSCS